MADLLKRLQISEQQYGVGMEDNPFHNASPDECMNVCFGGSGGGGSPPPPPPQTMTQQTSNIPEYFQPYLERLFERAEGVTTEPFQRYEGQRLALPTEQQQAAYQGVEEMVGGYKPYIATADLLTAQAAQQSTDPTAIAARMSPYQQSVIDIQKREALRDANKLQQQIGASAVGAGAFGGSRQALAETELGRQTGQRLADIQAVGSQQAYQQAMNQLSADRAASLAAGQQFAGLGAQQQQLGLAGLGALETVGGTQQAQQQRALDIGYEDFARETTYPQQQVQEMSSVLRGFNLPVSTYTTSQAQQAPPTFGQQAAGLGLGALGIYGAGKGVGLFAEGGDVPDNPGLKKLASKAPQVVEKMGFDPQEVMNAYMGGKVNFQNLGRVPGDRTYSDGTPLPFQIGPQFFESMKDDFSIIDYLRNKNILRDPNDPIKFFEPKDDEEKDDRYADFNKKIDDLNKAKMEKQSKMAEDNRKKMVEIKEDKEDKDKKTYEQKETDVADRIQNAEQTKANKTILGLQSRIDELQNQLNNQTTTEQDPDSPLFNSLVENLNKVISPEKTEFEKYTDAITAGAAGARLLDVGLGNVGREDANKILDKGQATISGLATKDQDKILKAMPLLTTGASLETERYKIGENLKVKGRELAMNALKLDRGTADKAMEAVLENYPGIVQELTSEKPKIRKEAEKVFLDLISNQVRSSKFAAAGFDSSDLEKFAKQSESVLKYPGGINVTED
jgi:hypothetical protein